MPIASRKPWMQWPDHGDKQFPVADRTLAINNQGSNRTPFCQLIFTQRQSKLMAIKEGNLEAPKREPLDWQNPQFYDKDSLYTEMERVFDICHGCRRCVSLCNSFPTLFDLVDESSTMEVDGVDRQDYWKVVDNCYLCDLCYLTKCPYVPPHEWNVDFPHLMLRAKAARFRKQGASMRDKVLAATSHLPHMLAFALVHHLSNLNDHEEIFRYAAGGFRDFTRIASSDPVMWRDICIANSDALIDLIEQYQDELDRVKLAISDGDTEELLRLFSRAKSERDSLIGNC